MLWEERERTRAELFLALDRADASFSRGEGSVITEQSMRELASKVNARGRAQLLDCVESSVTPLDTRPSCS